MVAGPNLGEGGSVVARTRRSRVGEEAHSWTPALRNTNGECHVFKGAFPTRKSPRWPDIQARLYFLPLLLRNKIGHNST